MRFGPGAVFCAVGDGAEERQAAAALGWPFVHICMAPARSGPGARASTSMQGLGSCELTALTAEKVVRRALSGAASVHPGRNTRPKSE